MPSSNNRGCLSYFVHFLFRLLCGQEIPLTEFLFVLGVWNCPTVLVFCLVTALYCDRSVVNHVDRSAENWIVAVFATLFALCGIHLVLYLFYDVCAVDKKMRVPVWSGRLYFAGHVVLGIYAAISIYNSDSQMSNFWAVCWSTYWLIFGFILWAYQYVLSKYARLLREKEEQERQQQEAEDTASAEESQEECQEEAEEGSSMEDVVAAVDDGRPSSSSSSTIASISAEVGDDAV